MDQPPAPQAAVHSLAMPGAGVYYVNPSAAGVGGVPQQQFMMLGPRGPVSFGSQYAMSAQSSQPQPLMQDSPAAAPVSMPMQSYSCLAPATGQPVAYLVSPGAMSAATAPALLPVPFAAYPPQPSSLPPLPPYPASLFPTVSVDPSTPSFPEYRLFTSSPTAVQGMSQSTPGAPTSFAKQSPPPPVSAPPQQQQPPQQHSSLPSNPTPPLVPGSTVNPQYFSGYTICAPPVTGVAPLAVNQFCQVTGTIGHHANYPHQYHQTRTRNPTGGSKGHFRS